MSGNLSYFASGKVLPSEIIQPLILSVSPLVESSVAKKLSKDQLVRSYQEISFKVIDLSSPDDNFH